MVIAGHSYGPVHIAQGVIDFRAVFALADDDADRRVLSLNAYRFIERGQVELHLAGVLGLKSASLQLDSYQALELAVVEEKIDEVFFVAHLYAELAPHEREVA